MSITLGDKLKVILRVSGCLCSGGTPDYCPFFSGFGMDLGRLVDIAAEKAINDHRILKRNLYSLPRTIWESLLVAAIRQDRLLSLECLIIQWPFKQLVLRDCPGLVGCHAQLLARLLQKSRHHIEVIDLRGCEIGILGTTAFCNAAIQCAVQDRISSQSEETDLTSESDDHHRILHHPPITVYLNCDVNDENYKAVRQALVHHSVVNIKVCKLTIREMGRAKVCSLASLLEPSIITGLDCQFNSLEQEGTVALSKTLTLLTNLTELNLAYNRLKQQDLQAVNELVTAFSHLPKLRKLNLSENILGGEICKILRSIISPLSQLCVNGCGIRDAELQAMTEMDNLHHLHHLELSVNALVNCVKSVSKFVCKSAETLQYLAIEDNMFVTASVPRLCRTLQKLRTLRTLSICYNHLLHDDVETIRKAIPGVDVKNKDYLF